MVGTHGMSGQSIDARVAFIREHGDETDRALAERYLGAAVSVLDSLVETITERMDSGQ